jgi:hypothetical protein
LFATLIDTRHVDVGSEALLGVGVQLLVFFKKIKSLALASVAGARPSRGVRRTTFFKKKGKVWRWPQWPELARPEVFVEPLFSKNEKFNVGFVVVGSVVVD